MDKLTEDRLIETARGRIDAVAEEVLAARLQPDVEIAFVLKVDEMDDMDHLAIEMAKGKKEHKRLMDEAERTRVKHGKYLGR